MIVDVIRRGLPKNKLQIGGSLKLRIASTLYVIFGLWVAQTACFPIVGDVLPSWFLYGWPICFATGYRERFGFSSFDIGSLIVDIAISAMLIGCTWLTVRHFQRKLPKFSISDVLAITAGFACLLFVISDGYSAIFELFSIFPPGEYISEMNGNSYPWEWLPKTAMPPLCIGAFSIGFMISIGTMNLLTLKTRTKSEQIAG